MILKAFLLARKAHKGQMDKSGTAYIKHPVAVARMCSTKEERITALLHDVIEDTDITSDNLFSYGIPLDIVDAIVCLSKKKGIDYFEYLRNVKKNPLARAVNIADFTHNMNLSRLNSISDEDIRRVEKYKKAILFMRK